MDTKLLGSCSFAGFAIIALVTHLAGASTETFGKLTPVAGFDRQVYSFSRHDQVVHKLTAKPNSELGKSIATKAPDIAPTKALTSAAASQNRLQKALESSWSVFDSTLAKPSQTIKRAKAFAHTPIVGFLQPQGFTRLPWQTLATHALIHQKAPKPKQFLVMIDPGHGGTDPGAKAHNGLLEKNLTLDIARRARLFLTEIDGIDVVLSREHDHGLSRLARVERIKRSGADMVISLHFNHLPQTDVTLVESFYAGPENISQSLFSQRASNQQSLRRASHSRPIDLSFTKGSERLARTLQRRVFSEVSHGNDSVMDAGIKRDTLFVLTRSFKPGALIEMTALSNIREAEKLLDDDYKNRLAAALVDGIRQYRDSLITNPLPNDADVGA